ncbi:MAG TPA: putative ABC exporter domain-containing protein, partial [Gammaproteobacteria bacterium]
MSSHSIAGALLYLRWTTTKGWFASRLRRLKQPKYAVGAVIGVVYIYSFFIRNFAQNGFRRPPAGDASAPGAAEALSFAPEIAAAFLLIVIALNWIVPRGRAGLVFSEAEISFLFPAPIGRRTLIHYRLLTTLGTLALTALFFTIVSGRWAVVDSAWMRGVSWWLVLSTISLHFTATSFVVTRLLDRGVSSLARGAAGLAVLVLAVGVPMVWTLYALPPPTQQDLAGVPALTRYLESALQSGPLPWLLAVPKLVMAPLFAADVPAFALALGPALLVLAAHYAWVLFSAVSFEEASIAKAEKRATRMAALRSGSFRRAAVKKVRDPFPLPNNGRPAVAFLWKNLAAMGSLFTLRSALIAAAIVAAACLWLAFAGLRGGQVFVSVLSTAIFGITLLLGAQFARHDLRSDLKNADILKTYPLDGATIVFGEMLAPLAVLSVIAWLAVLAVTLSSVAAPLPIYAKAGGALAVGVFVPFFCALQLVLQNGIALLFPAWVQSVSNQGEHGLDVMGQRILFLAAQMFVLMLGLLPAAIGAAVAFFAVFWLAGPIFAGLLAWVAALTVLGVEVWA